MHSVKRLPVVSKTFLITSLAGVLALAATSSAYAVQTLELETLCAEDVSNVGSCTANEVSLSNVTNVTITDLADNVLTECTAGQQIKILTLDAQLDANTGERFDVTFWIGRFGNDPRIATGNPAACAALSLPDDTGSTFIANLEGGAADNCEDLAQPDVALPISFGGGGAELTCADSNGDMIADLQVLTTWHQNTGFACGVGDPSLSPGAPSKCDYTIINLVPFILNAEMSIEKTVTDVDGAGAGGSVDAVGDVISYQVVVTNTGDATLTNVDVDDPLLGDFACDVAIPAATLAAGGVITCTGTYAATQADMDAAGPILNESFASSVETGILNDDASVPVVAVPGLTLEKTSATTEITAAGQVVQYSFVLTNVGTVSLTTVSLSDPSLDATAVCNPAQGSGLAPGAVMTCTGQHTVTESDLSLSALVNTATATSSETAPVIDTFTIPISVTPPPPPAPSVPVPVDGKWALVLLMLMMLGVGLYFRPIARRRGD